MALYVKPAITREWATGRRSSRADAVGRMNPSRDWIMVTFVVLVAEPTATF